jgi:hypothetical protein
MSFTMRSQRSPLDQPMDFEFTSRPSSGVKPVWARSDDPSGGQGGDPSTPRKRPFDSTAPTTPFAPNAPRFGAGNNVPFIFEAPPPQPHTPTGWAPPPDFSPSKAFPELQDVDMADASPPKPHLNMEGDTDGGRTVSLGALKRVFRRREARRKATERVQDQDATDSESGSDDEEQSDQQLLSPRPRRAIRKTTSNHWTLNMPSAAAPQSELPALLLGYVTFSLLQHVLASRTDGHVCRYLQFFFNLSLVLVFLYLLLQFILTVQRDVEQKIAEYSLGKFTMLCIIPTRELTPPCCRHRPRNFHLCSPIPSKPLRREPNTRYGQTVCEMGAMHGSGPLQSWPC